MTALLANPIKSATLAAAGLALLGSATGLYIRISGRFRGSFALVAGAILGGLIGAFSGYINRRQKNENILDLMQRLQPGATKRDMLSDPVFQSDLDRRAARAAGGSDLFTAALLGSTMNRGYHPQRR